MKKIAIDASPVNTGMLVSTEFAPTL